MYPEKVAIETNTIKMFYNTCTNIYILYGMIYEVHTA